jgi:hypothetical protein
VIRTLGGVGGESIDFDAAATNRKAGYIAVEPKICEWCGRGFCRVVGSGAKDCPNCSGRLERLASHPVNPGPMKRRIA